jgi:hypothetical protein
MPKGTFDLKAWALLGAQQRLAELEDERSSILAAFPQLRRGGRVKSSSQASAGARSVTGAAIQPDGVGKRRRRRKMSAAARKAISDAQKARWAKLKRAQK